MTHSTDPLERLVEDYLTEVAHATAALPAGRREDLIADLREHIAVARSELYPPTPAGIRTILDRLGEPAAIAEEARLGEPVPATSTFSPGTPTLSRAAIRRRSSPSTPALVLGFVLVLIVIVVGACAVTLLPASPEEDPPSVVRTWTSPTAPAPR